MSIYFSQTLTRPASYTQDLKAHDSKFDYKILKKEVRNSIYDRFKEFDKLGVSDKVERKTTQNSSPNRSQSKQKVGLYYQSLYSSSKAIQPKDNNLFTSISVKKSEFQSPLKMSGLQKQMSSLGLNKQSSSFINLSTVPTNIYKTTDQSVYQGSLNSSTYQNNQPSYLSVKQQSTAPTVRTNLEFRSQSSLFSSGAQERDNKDTFQSKKPILSTIIPIQKLVEVQNLLELTPHSDLAQFPKHYLEELLKVGQAITHTLKYHHDQQRLRI